MQRAPAQTPSPQCHIIQPINYRLQRLLGLLFCNVISIFDFLACKLIDLNFIDHISSSLYLKKPTLIIASPAFLKHRAVFGLSIKMYSKMTLMNTTFVEVVYGWALQWPLDQQGAESATIAAAQWSRQETVIKVMILSSKAGNHFL